MKPGNVWSWLVLGGLLVGGFIAGRASVRVDDRELRDSLAVYRHTRKTDKDERDSLVRVILFARTAVDIAEGDAARARAQARQLTVSAGRFGARADSLERLLAFAKTPADSIPILLAACTERRNECGELRKANAELLTSIGKDSTAKAGLRTEIAAHLQTRDADSMNAVRADRLIGQLEKQVRGCRLLILPCPELNAAWNLTDQTVDAGIGMPIQMRIGVVKVKVRVGVTTQLWKP